MIGIPYFEKEKITVPLNKVKSEVNSTIYLKDETGGRRIRFKKIKIPISQKAFLRICLQGPRRM